MSDPHAPKIDSSALILGGFGLIVAGFIGYIVLTSITW